MSSAILHSPATHSKDSAPEAAPALKSAGAVPSKATESLGPAAPSPHELVLKVIPMPADANINGDIFGGWVMAQVDLAGSVLPYRIAKGRLATVAVKEFIFKQPVRLGDILNFYAHVTRIGRTSITVDVEVFAERRDHYGEYTKVTEATLTYVAIDDAGRPRPLSNTQ